MNASLSQVFVGARLHVTGGVVKGGRAVEGNAAIAGNICSLFYALLSAITYHLLISFLMFVFLFMFEVLDTAAGVWLDRNGVVTSRGNKVQTDPDPSLEAMRRCRHAAASVGVRIYIYGGLKGGKVSTHSRIQL